VGIASRQGRTIAPSDGAQTMSVVVVNDAFARKYFPGEDVLGKRIRLGGPTPTCRG